MLTNATRARWSAERFKVTIPGTSPPVLWETKGWVYHRSRARAGHVGLCLDAFGHWWIVHLKSGYRVLRMEGEARDVMPLATEVAEITDWSFDGPTGWRKTDPELAGKLAMVWAKNPVLIPWNMEGPPFDAVRAIRQAAEEKDDAELLEIVAHVERQG